MPPEEDRAAATGKQDFVKIGPAVPERCSLTDRHTDRQTDKLIATLCTPTGAE